VAQQSRMLRILSSFDAVISSCCEMQEKIVAPPPRSLPKVPPYAGFSFLTSLSAGGSTADVALSRRRHRRWRRARRRCPRPLSAYNSFVYRDRGVVFTHHIPAIPQLTIGRICSIESIVKIKAVSRRPDSFCPFYIVGFLILQLAIARMGYVFAKHRRRVLLRTLHSQILP